MAGGDGTALRIIDGGGGRRQYGPACGSLSPGLKGDRAGEIRQGFPSLLQTSQCLALSVESNCGLCYQEGVFMEKFSSVRREFLRFGSLGVAAAAIPAMSLVASGQETAASQGLFDVRKYGATGDGKTLDTDAVNHAIEAASAAGGGVVVFPPGTYLCFPIHLKSLVHLHLLQGSTIMAADSPLPGEQSGYRGGSYDAAEPKTTWDAYQDYGHNHWHNSLLWGEDIHDFSITGTGLIWGRGLSFGAGPGNPPVVPRSDFGWGPATAPGTAAPPPEPAHPPRGDYPMYQAEQPGVG